MDVGRCGSRRCSARKGRECRCQKKCCEDSSPWFHKTALCLAFGTSGKSIEACRACRCDHQTAAHGQGNAKKTRQHPAIRYSGLSQQHFISPFVECNSMT